MADGQQGKPKIGAIIQARMGSSRLPGKILMPIPFGNGKPLLQWIVDSLKKSKLISQIVLASSTDTANDPLEDFCRRNSIVFFRGSENDVLSRFVTVSEESTFDHVVRVTGDNPVLDVEMLDFVCLEHITKDADYTSSVGLPVGMNIEVVRASCLIDTKNNPELIAEDREHVTFFFRRVERFKKSIVRFDSKFTDYRVTVDYPIDFAVVSLIIGISLETGLTGLNLIEHIAANKSWIFTINDGQLQKKAFQNESEEVSAAIDLLRSQDMLRAASILKAKST
jgi:spore coat polysaccharide biosynthesis protein SpsF